ncbi:MAG TPA: hypothetical protein PKE29_17795 [Phycisphaerales bacterium]|nr:hypothetical protein [Phycisphaerales bacterium]
MPQMIRKKIKWPTKRRKCGSRVWKTRWIMVAQHSGTPNKPAEKPADKKA